MASKTEIANLALSHLGVSKSIGNLTSEQSAEAKACRRFYDITLKTTLRDVEWPFATVVVDLGLTASNPTEEWDYSYTYPSECERFVRILSGKSNDTRQSRVPYEIYNSNSSRVIYTNEENAQAEIVKLVEDPGFYPSDFQLALSYRLAAYIAPRLTNGDPFNIMNKVMDMYTAEIDKAKANSLNEEQPKELPDSEFVRARS